MRHALAHRQRTLAALAQKAGAAPSELRANANEYELMLVALAEDRRRLKQVQSVERKIAVKRELLPKYAAWCAGVIASDSPRQDDVFMTVLLWLIDVADFDSALPLAEYAIRHRLQMPDRFERTTACLIAEEMADTSLKETGPAQAAFAPHLYACVELTAEQDMPDEVRAKLLKARAYALLACVETPPDIAEFSASDARNTALECLRRALQLHDKVGVKKDIERLEREIKNTADDKSA